MSSVITTYYSNFSSTIFATVTENNNVTTTNEKPCEWSIINTALAIGCSLTLLFNLLASVVLFRVPLVNIRGRSNPVYLCIRSMNICDISQAFLMLTMPLFTREDCTFIGDNPFCNFMAFLALFLLLISPLITILMAFDRVFALYKPFIYRSNVGMKVLKNALQISILFVFVIALLPIFGVGEYHVVRGRRVCLIDTITDDIVDYVYVITVHSIFVIALCLLLACTFSFQFKLTLLENDKKNKRRKASSKRTRNATMTTMAICLIFIFCYSPYIIRVLKEASTGEKSSQVVTYVTFALAFLQPLINPLVCVGANARYRKELLVVMKKIGAGEMESSSDSGTTNARVLLNDFRRRLKSNRMSLNKAFGFQQNESSSPKTLTSIESGKKVTLKTHRDSKEPAEKYRKSTKTSVLLSPLKEVPSCSYKDDDVFVSDGNKSVDIVTNLVKVQVDDSLAVLEEDIPKV